MYFIQINSLLFDTLFYHSTVGEPLTFSNLLTSYEKSSIISLFSLPAQQPSLILALSCTKC